jgi:glycine cleavage system aminomethyltransferase T
MDMEKKWTAMLDDYGQIYGDPYVTIDDGSKAVAYIMTRDRARGRDINDWKANAHLIAAAPDMYDALEMARRKLLQAGFFNASYECDAALAKARGE